MKISAKPPESHLPLYPAWGSPQWSVSPETNTGSTTDGGCFNTSLFSCERLWG